ncbi:MAG: SDR family NAD(P)-dependent oxidoreductase [Devosia sp.]
MDMGLGGLRVLVTGGSSGIGAALVRAFAGSGAHVAVHYNSRRDDAEALVREAQGKGVTALAVGANLGSPGHADDLVKAAADGLGGLDILINNAGALVGRRPLAEFEPESFDQVMDVNFRSVLECAHAAHPFLKASGKGAIVNTGSIAARHGGGRGSGLYAAAKAGVHSLTRTMAKEFAADGIRANAVAPGVITTPLHDTTPKAAMETMLAQIVMGRFGTPEDCVGAYLFLASPTLAGYITGQIIDVNGGQYMP